MRAGLSAFFAVWALALAYDWIHPRRRGFEPSVVLGIAIAAGLAAGILTA